MTGRARLRNALLARAPGAGQPVTLGADKRPNLPDGARVLIIRPDHLGDVLFAGPALSLLAARRPDAALTLLVGPWAADLAQRLPGAAHVRTLDFPWFDRRPRGAPWRPYTRLLVAARRLRRERYDAAAILRDDDYWSAWLAAVAGIPVRAGHDRPGVRPFLTHALAEAPDHTAAANLALVGALTGTSPDPSPTAHPLALDLQPADRERADALLAPVAGANRPPLAVHPGSGAAVKRWRTGAWIEAVRALAAPGQPVALTGSAGEAPLTAAIAEGLENPIVDLAGRTNLGALAAVFARCALVLGPDSGPLHLAVSTGTPTVHLFGPADAARFGPWGSPDRHRVVSSELPCAPCGRLDWPDAADHPCVRTIELARVVAAGRHCCHRAAIL